MRFFRRGKPNGKDAHGGKVVPIDSFRSHLTICGRKSVHVVPLHLVISWARGEEPLPEDDILRRIIAEWLACVHAGCVQHAAESLEEGS